MPAKPPKAGPSVMFYELLYNSTTKAAGCLIPKLLKKRGNQAETKKKKSGRKRRLKNLWVVFQQPFHIPTSSCNVSKSK